MPHTPQNPWTAIAPTGSSNRNLSRIRTPYTTTTPATAPMPSAASGLTTAHGAVTPTSPANTPFSDSARSGLPNFSQAKTITTIAPATAARLVLIAINAICSGSSKPRVEPALKPNQPSQSMNVPSATSGILWPPMTFGVPSGLNLPILGPIIHVPTKAANPPTPWTTVDPAKS